MFSRFFGIKQYTRQSGPTFYNADTEIKAGAQIHEQGGKSKWDFIINIKDSPKHENENCREPEYLSKHGAHILRLTFDDWLGKSDSIFWAPDAGRVQRIINFSLQIKEHYEKNSGNTHVMIVTRSARSRGPATELIILNVLAGAGHEVTCMNKLLQLQENVLPNSLMIKLADDDLDRKGKMVAALHNRPVMK